MRLKLTTAHCLTAIVVLAVSRMAHCQPLTRPAEFVIVPVGGHWMSFFAEDWEATNTAGRLRLKGPVKCVEETFSMVQESSPEHGPVPRYSVLREFDEHGNVRRSVQTDIQDDEKSETAYVIEYQSVADRLLPKPVRVGSVVVAASEATIPTPPWSFDLQYDGQGQLVSTVEDYGQHPRKVRLERDQKGRLVRAMVDDGDGENTYEFDENGCNGMRSQADLQSGSVSAWTGRAVLDWGKNKHDNGAGEWIRFDERGTPVEWQMSFGGPTVRFFQAVSYDDHGNWTSLAVTMSGTKIDGTPILGMIYWTFTRTIEYHRPMNSPDTASGPPSASP